MRPGPELNALIDEFVMGNSHTPSTVFPLYSEDIAAAWKVLERAHSEGFVWVIEQADTSEFPTVHIPRPTREEIDKGFVHFIEDMEKLSESAESTAHAICLVALKAFGVKI